MSLNIGAMHSTRGALPECDYGFNTRRFLVTLSLSVNATKCCDNEVINCLLNESSSGFSIDCTGYIKDCVKSKTPPRSIDREGRPRYIYAERLFAAC